MGPWMLRDAIELCWIAAVLLTLLGFYTFVGGEWAPSYPLLIGAGTAILLSILTMRPHLKALTVV